LQCFIETNYVNAKKFESTSLSVPTATKWLDSE